MDGRIPESEEGIMSEGEEGADMGVAGGRRCRERTQ